MQPKRFTLSLLISIGLILAVIATVNRVVDPFWYYRDFEIEGLNKIKTKMRRFERHVKPMIIVREQPDALIFGSSFSEIGFDPTHTEFTDHGKLAGYNFGIAGAGWERVLCYYDYAIESTDVKRVIIGITPGTMPRIDCKGKLPEIEEFSESKLLLSLKAISASISTVKEQRKNSPSHTREGMYYYIRGLPGVDAQFRQFFNERLKKQRCDLTALRQSMPAPVVLADALPKADTSLDLEGLRHIIRLAKQKGIELTLFAYPKHALWLELDAVCGAYQSYWSGLAAIASLVEQEGGKTELWEFTRYNDMTAEIITKNSAVYWQDPEHFNYEFGNMIFDAIYKHQPESDFGSRITPQNISHAYQQYLASRNAYFGTHQNMLTSLRKQLF
ncbi:MAG: hypothetical protein ACR65R_20570 [Methylomicrobium sp.]